MAKPEDKFQYQIVQRFSDEFPTFSNCLWECNNDVIGGMAKMNHRIAMGMVPGASDLQMFCFGVFSGIECKVKGMKHNKATIERQKAWGLDIVKNGGNYIMSTDIDNIFEFIYLAMCECNGMYNVCY